MKEYQLISMLPGLLLVVFGVMAQSYWTELRWMQKRSEDQNVGIDRRSRYLRSYHQTFILFRLVSIAAGLCLIAWFVPLFVSSKTSYEVTKYVLASTAVIILTIIALKFSGRLFLLVTRIFHSNSIQIADKKRKV